jgi:alpha-D-xyloside xylohydrolase
VLEAWKGRPEDGDWNNFSRERFPDLAGYFDFMRRHGVRTVLWQVPLIFPSDPQYARAAANGYFVRDANGDVSLRKGWLAGSAHVDFTNPDAVRWWTAQMEDEIRLGVAGFKTDDGEDIDAGDVFSNGQRGWELHNRYATLYNQAVFDALRALDPQTLVWSRAGSVGRERSPALWAGDQAAEWRSLDSVIVAGLSAGVSGMPFWGHDIGGYLGDPTPEMYRRWTQLGAWSPFMQYHGISAREPWLFGEQALENYRLNVQLRMNLLPTLVELGRTAARTGLPIMRPMFMEFPHEPAFRDDFTQYMLGGDILVAPITNPGLPGRDVQFPPGRWIHPVTGAAYEAGKRFVPIGQVDAPVFLREGARLRVALPADVPQLRPYAWRPGSPERTITVGPDPGR